MMPDHFSRRWSGRVDSEEMPADAQRLHQQIQPFTSASSGIVIIGFCCDEGVSRNQGRVGAKVAPVAIRKKIANLPWSNHQPVFDWGDIHCIDHDLLKAQQSLALAVQQSLSPPDLFTPRLLEHGQSAHSLPFVLGGGHEMAYGSWLGLIQHLEVQASGQQVKVPSIGIINFDAHFDLRSSADKSPQSASSGTPFYQIAKQCQVRGYPFNYCCLGVSETANTQALFKRADALHVSYRQDSEMQISQLADISAQLSDFMQRCEWLYLSIDLDVLPAWVAPGVSAPASHGVALEVIEVLIQQIKASGKLRLADIAEYNPLFDIDTRTAAVAARLFYKIVKEESPWPIHD